MKHVKIRVFGQVQGVFFRQTAKEQANQLGITGFARNEPDGTVYIEAEGDEEKINQFIEWCKTGSQLAEVADINTSEDEPRYFEDFVTA